MITLSIALFIEGTYPWYRGGVSEWVAYYLEAFPNYEFTIVQLATDPYLQTTFASALYEVPPQVQAFYRIEPPPYSTRLPPDPWIESHFDNFEKVLSKADIIHITNTGFAGWLGKAFAEKLQKPLVLTEHALYSKEIEMGAVALECGYKIPQNSSGKNQLAGLFRKMARQIYSVADEVISVSQCNIAHQQAMGARHVRYIPNGVAVEWLKPARETATGNSLVIGWIGRCAEMKNPLRFFDLVDAFSARDCSGVRFLIMVCDANEPKLQAQVVNRASQYEQVQLVVNQPAKKYLPEMDALCISSHNESQPLVLLEALAQKVLPVGWQAGDVTDDRGLIYPQSTPAPVLAERIAALWSQPRTWRKQVNTGFNQVQQQHTWPIIFNQYRDIFKSHTNTTTVYDG